MKKALFKIFGMGLAVCLLLSSFAGCSSASWKGSSVSGWGAVKEESLGGFIAETENFYFYINGIGSVSSDNTLGVPTKGALYAIKKNDLSTNVVTVPKLFSTTDYAQGLYFNGDYVYYGTNSTEKNADGDIAYGEMTFTRSKLHGTETTAYFTVDSLSVQHRFVEKDGKVYIVYFDSTDNEILSYDTSAKASTSIAKKDEKTDIPEDAPETLDVCSFADVVGEDGLVLAYTTTIYTEKYNEDRLEDTESTRGTESYNNVYAVVGGADKAQVIYEGKAKNEKFAITMIKGGYVYYTKTVGATTKAYAVTVENFLNKQEGVEIIADYATTTNLIVSLDQVYTVSEGKVYKDTMIKANASNATKQLVAKDESITTLLLVDGNNLYFYDASNYISRVELGKENADIFKVSDNAVATTWYAPEIVEFNGKKTLFYVDVSSSGMSYVKYVDLTSTVKGEDTDDDGENDTFYLEGQEFISVMSAEDTASVFEAKVNNLDTKLEDGKLVYTEKNGALTVSAVEDVRKAYDNLSKEAKEYVEETVLEKLENMEKAIKIANLLNKLDGIYNFDMLNETEKTALKTAYETIKSEIEAFYASDDKDAVIAYINTNLLYNYQRAGAEFAK